MLKKISFLFLVFVLMFAIYGCSQVSNSSSSSSNLPTGVTVGSPIPSPEATLTGTVAKISGVTALNLGGIIPTGSTEPVTVDLSKMSAYVASGVHTSAIKGKTTVEWAPLSLGFYDISATPIDIVFVLDNTGSMSGTITGLKDSITAFAATLESAGVDAKFALVSYGDSALHPTPAGYITSESFTDAYYERPIMDFGTSTALENILTSVEADGGGDGPENPLDCIKWALTTNATTGALTNLTWRPGAQKIFVVLTDINGHQTSEVTFIDGAGNPVTDEAAGPYTNNRCTTYGLAEITRLKNFNAKVYAVSPDYPDNQAPYVDVRMLADGYGEGRTTSEAAALTTGGQWIQMPYGGAVDLTDLGISTTLVSGRVVKLEGYTFAAGTVYTIIVYYDTDADGIMDSYAYFVYSATSSSAVKAKKAVRPAPLGLHN